MRIAIHPDAAAVGEHAARILAHTVQRRPDAVLGFATGSSPGATYEALARHRRDGLAMEKVRGFALDEYVGLPAGHPESYRSVIDREVVRRLGLTPGNVHVPDGAAGDLGEACRSYEEAIRAAGGVDVQLLGIGANGHIGFNEPTSSFASRTRVKTLSPRTREDNSRFFGGDIAQVPMHCLTQGIGTILEARALVLVATGTAKAAAVAQMIEGPLGAFCPATALQLHAHATVILDEEAASELRTAAYYRHTEANRPGWQLP
ncbi:glucosamine-6-phosphate deaminase [Arthrobacter sp. TMN-37]